MNAAQREVPPLAVAFRRALIDALWDPERFGCISSDAFVGSCPVCGDAVGVHMHGYAPRVTLHCHGGCTEDEIAATLGVLRARP